jgi:hypothetical protein
MIDSYSAWMEALEKQMAERLDAESVTGIVNKGLAFALLAAVGNLYHVLSNVNAEADAHDKFADGVERHVTCYREAIAIVKALNLDGGNHA